VRVGGVGKAPGVTLSRVKGACSCMGSFASLRMTRSALRMTRLSVGVTAAALFACLLAAPVRAQTFEVLTDSGRITVGDPVTLRLVLRQHEGDALLEQVAHPEAVLAGGVRLLSVDSMRPVANLVLEAHARIAFYRPGRQTIPGFAIDFRRGAVILHGTMRSEPVPIEILPVLSAGGGPTLRDIREIVEVPGPDPRLVAGVALALALALWAFRRRRRGMLVPAPALATLEVGPPATAPDPFAIAVGRLAEIEGAGWGAGADVARHYQAVADALRDYLEAAEGIPARERTTTELRSSLPAWLLDASLRQRYDSVFDEADLVKFARRRPDAAAASAFLGHARDLLARWRETTPAGEALHAVR